MKTTSRLCVVAFVLFLIAPAGAADDIKGKAFPQPLPTDITFDDVVAQYPFRPLPRYSAPIIGWKHHPEEFHITATGAVALPEPRWPAGLYITPYFSSEEKSALTMLDPDGVKQSLMDGYKPGVRSEWRAGDVKLEQLAFATLLAGDEVVTGREVLLAHVRYTLSNPSAEEQRGVLWLTFGQSVHLYPLKQPSRTYPAGIDYAAPFVTEKTGEVAACVVGNEVGTPVFHQGRPAQRGESYTVLNESEMTLKGAEFSIDVERDGEQLKVGSWTAPAGADLYFESSSKHSSGAALDVEVVGADGAIKKCGILFRTGLAQEMRPAAEFLAPGEHAPPIKWDVLAKSVPQGKSRIVLRAWYPAASGPARPIAWEPLVYFARPGTAPIFKGSGGDPRENSLSITFALKPGESKRLELAIPYYPLPADAARQLTKVNWDERLAHFRAFWERELNRNAEFIVPEPRVRDSYRACLGYNLLLVDRDPATGLLLPHPDATMYEHVWAGDSGVIMQSMDRMGYAREVEDYTKNFLVRQGTRKPEGDVDSADGFFPGDVNLRWMSENGFILWALAEHYKLTGDRAWLRAVAPRLVASADWIIRTRAHTKKLDKGEKPRHYGLLPKGRPSDLDDWDYWYFNDCYSYMGLRDAADVLAEIGMDAEARRLAADAADYKSCILDSMNRSINREVDPPFVPPTPYLNAKPTAQYLYRYWYSISSPIYMVEAGLLDASEEKATWVNAWIERLVCVSGLPKFTNEVIDPHYVYHQALSQLLRSEADKFVWTLYSLLAFGQSRDTYGTIELVNLDTGLCDGPAWNGCRQPHMHSNSRVLSMLRIALLLEKGRELHLMMGTPRGWLDDGKRIEVRRAASEFGEVNYAAESRLARGEVAIEVQPPTRRPAELILHVRPPSRFGAIRAVIVNGQPFAAFTADTVRLGKIDAPAKVVCTFAPVAGR